MDREFEYEQPRIEDFGDLAEITAASASGGHLDANFASGTPSSALTFS